LEAGYICKRYSVFIYYLLAGVLTELFTLGYAYVLSGKFGRSSSNPSTDNRISQEALLPQKRGRRTFINNRFRFEQRWVDKTFI